MHSPIAIPNRLNDNNFLELKAGFSYHLSYNRWKTVLLPPPYQTNCKNYDLDDKHNYKLRSDCINHCIHNGLSRECSHCPSSSGGDNNCTECLERSDLIWRKVSFDNSLKDVMLCEDFWDLLKRFGFGRIDSDKHKMSERTKKFERYQCHQNVLSRINAECQVECPLECINRYYNYDVKSESGKTGTWTKNTRVEIVHNQMPDQMVTNIPEMTFIRSEERRVGKECRSRWSPYH